MGLEEAMEGDVQVVYCCRDVLDYSLTDHRPWKDVQVR